MPRRYAGALLGGHPALDFLNTINDWFAAEPVEYLAEFDDAVAFGVAAGVLTRGEGDELATTGSGVRWREVAELHTVRAALERVVRACVRGEAAPAPELALLARHRADAVRQATYRNIAGAPLQHDIAVARAGAAVLRFRLVEAAMQLLTSPVLARVGECPGCGWFFLDQTKNGSRRWCSMEMCGSSAKSRAYYRRRSGRALGSGGTADPAAGIRNG